MALSNHALRIIVASITIPIIISAAYFGGIFFLFFVLVITIVSYYEFCTIVKNKKISANMTLGLAGITIILINYYRTFIDIYPFLLFFSLILFLVELFRNRGSFVSNIGATLLGVIYLGLLGSSIIGIREFYPNIGTLYERGGYLMISIFASIWLCDSAAFWGGSKLGKHKLFPRVSPNKSWEGSIFGFFFSVIVLILAKIFILDFLSYTNAIIIGIIIGIFGQLGDLIESLIKRDTGVKDSSGLIPGHGGMFDRFDSLFYTAPVILLYLTYIGR
jgi:phosphatidate cytidylyltransferase